MINTLKSMFSFFSKITLLFLSSKSFLWAMDQPIDQQKIDPQITNGFYYFSSDIFDAFFAQLPSNDQVTFLSTCHKFNLYGLQSYYPRIHPELKDLNWYELDFLTDHHKIRFNQLVIASVKIFDRESLLLGKDPCFSGIQGNDSISEVTFFKDSTTSGNLYSLSQEIIKKAQEAQTAHDQAQDRKDTQFSFLKWIDIYLPNTKAKSPLISLFQWISKYACGQVVVQSAYGEDPTSFGSYPVVKMSALAKGYLKTYSEEFESLLNQFDPGSFGEYGLHALLFGRWHAFSGYCFSFQRNLPHEPYRIYDGLRFSSPVYLNIPHISRKNFDRLAHPAFINLIKNNVLNKSKKEC